MVYSVDPWLELYIHGLMDTLDSLSHLIADHILGHSPRMLVSLDVCLYQHLQFGVTWLEAPPHYHPGSPDRTPRHEAPGIPPKECFMSFPFWGQEHQLRVSPERSGASLGSESQPMCRLPSSPGPVVRSLGLPKPCSFHWPAASAPRLDGSNRLGASQANPRLLRAHH